MVIILAACSGSDTLAESTSEETNVDTGVKPTVYFTSDISAEGLVKIYGQLGWEPTGKLAVKVSTGEPPASNYLRQELIGELVSSLDGTYVECLTAYGGQRSGVAMAKQVALDQACYDLILQAEGNESFVKRVESRMGLHTLEHAEEIGLGSRSYELVNIDE